jgi:uncharacterized membrane protein YraQ (UPF0718 family)
MAFLVGNPVLNPAVLIFIAFVLSWQFALVRLAVGVALVLLIAWYANRAGGTQVVSCEAPAPAPIEQQASLAQLALAWLQAFWWEVYTILPGYIVIVLLLGAARAWLFAPTLTLANGGVLALLVLAIVGTLFVIPTAGEVPIIQTLMGLGMGAAPALALLVTLPTLSLPTTYIVRKVFPARVLAGALGIVAVVGFATAAVGKLFIPA